MKLLHRAQGGLLLISLVCGLASAAAFPSTFLPQDRITKRIERSTTSPNQFPRCEEGFWGPACREPCRCGPHSLRCDQHRGCLCRQGWMGPRCQQPISACRAFRPCRWGHERCVDTAPGKYQCVCAEGFTRTKGGECVCDENHYGRDCEKLCSCGPNSLRCDRETGCICKQGWEGDHCRENVDECLTLEPCRGQYERCVDTPGSYECTCQEGYRYREDPFRNTRKCVHDVTTRRTPNEPTRPTNPPFQKECPRNHWGRNCDKLCRCSEMTLRCDRYEGCMCKQGWRGQYCTDRLDERKCPRNWWGLDCDKLCTCSEQTARCDRYEGCVCKQGWEGVHCTENINECLQPDPCPIGTCIDLPGSYRCEDDKKSTVDPPVVKSTKPPFQRKPRSEPEEGGWIRVHASVFYIMLAGCVVGILSSLSLICCMLCGSSSKTKRGPSNKDKAIVAYATLQEDAVFSIKAKGTPKY